MNQSKDFGEHRVLEPKFVLPTLAWKLDNHRDIGPTELRIQIHKIHIESTSFKQIRMEANDNEEKIKQKIIDIVLRRGKLHNPVTDTGGLVYGTVEEIGEQYDNRYGLKVGDQIICSASMTTIPLQIDRVLSVNRPFCQVDVEGYGILFARMPIVRLEPDIPVKLMLYALDESGTLLQVSNISVGKRRFLVVGNNELTNIFYGYAIRKVAREDAEIVCLLDRKTESVLQGSSMERLMEKVFSEVRVVDILKPMECLAELGDRKPFDLTVNCADIPGAETINILAARPGGSVMFANLINNYNIALCITESISKSLDVRCADGYSEAYDRFDKELIRDLAPYLEKAVETEIAMDDDPAYPLSRKSRLREVSGQRQVMLEDFVCESSAMAGVLDEILTISHYDCNVLITGDTGVGKEKVANIIYKNGPRKMQPFIKVNCASITSDLVESEFFGCEEGAMGETRPGGRKGFFELADNGTIFLDDVGELSLDMQAKLLRVIQDGEFRRVGGTVPVKTNVRLLSATNVDLEGAVEQKKFRRDLYYRLNVVRIRIPNLRERPGDIPALVQHFLRDYGEKFDMKRAIDEDAINYLKQCPWEGNIRELENVVQRLMINATHEQITLLEVMKEMHEEVFEAAALDGAEVREEDHTMNLEKMVNNFEKNLLKMAIDQYGSTRKAAKAVGISQTQLVRKKKKYGI